MSTTPDSSSSGRSAKVGLRDLADMKAAHEKIVMITAYDYPSGRLADEAGVDTVLVGDSAAMCVLGHDSTVPITLEEMLVLAAATGVAGTPCTRTSRPRRASCPLTCVRSSASTSRRPRPRERPT